MIEVDEEGTVAAAATAIRISTRSLTSTPEKIKFIADHPFIFFLRDLKTGLLLFQGRVVDPRSWWQRLTCQCATSHSARNLFNMKQIVINPTPRITLSAGPPLKNSAHIMDICLGVQSIAHLNAQIQLCWKKYLCSFSESEGLNNDQTTLWIQNFASKFFSGLIKANPPKNTLYHSVQMVLVDPCDKFFISRFW